jgi:hypothetical protein
MELVLGSARAGARCNVDGGCQCFGLFSFQRVGEWETGKMNKAINLITSGVGISRH